MRYRTDYDYSYDYVYGLDSTLQFLPPAGIKQSGAKCLEQMCAVFVLKGRSLVHATISRLSPFGSGFSIYFARIERRNTEKRQAG